MKQDSTRASQKRNRNQGGQPCLYRGAHHFFLLHSYVVVCQLALIFCVLGCHLILLSATRYARNGLRALKCREDKRPRQYKGFQLCFIVRLQSCCTVLSIKLYANILNDSGGSEDKLHAAPAVQFRRVEFSCRHFQGYSSVEDCFGKIQLLSFHKDNLLIV